MNKGWELALPIPGWATGKDRETFEAARAEAVKRAELDPLIYGFEPKIWEVADKHRTELRAQFPSGVIHEVNLGGSRASKSERAAKRVVEACLETPGSRWWCCDSTEAQSRLNGQPLIWKYMPIEWKNPNTGSLKRTKTTKVRYSDAGGFTDNTVYFPNGSAIIFKFYEMNLDNLEGVELNGIWADELIPREWIEELGYRLVTRNGMWHVTFTPKKGYTPAVGYYLDDSTILEEEDAPLLPIRDETGSITNIFKKVPRVRQCKDQKARVINFFTGDNPFGNYPAMVEEVKHKSPDEVAIRVYGHCTRGVNVQFPRFDERIHVISLNLYKEMLLKKKVAGTRYNLIDPCSGRNWFIHWCWCPSPRKWIIYREWPSHGHAEAYIPGVGDPGEWALNGDSHDGQRGPAQDTFGFGLQRYRDEILRVEAGEDIWERWMDSRYGNSAKTEKEGTTTLIEQMHELDMEFLAMTSEKNILGANDGSIDMINSALYYDEKVPIGAFSPELGRLNEPELLIVETCPNTIFALKNWTGKDGQHGAMKDPIDTIRGLFLSQLDFISADAFKWVGGGSYGS